MSTSLAITQFQNAPVSRFSSSTNFSAKFSLSCAAALRLRSCTCMKTTKPMTTSTTAPTIMRLRLRTASRAAICRAYSSTLSMFGPAPG